VFADAGLQIVLQEAVLNGRKVRQDLEFFNIRAKDSNYEYALPQGLMVLNEEGNLLLVESELECVTGANGSKFLVAAQSTLVIKNHKASTLKFRAVQFELENAHLETPAAKPQDEVALITIAQEGSSWSSAGPRTFSVTFEDCAFVQDTAGLDTSEASAASAFEVLNEHAEVRVDLQFHNCVFVGFHHALKAACGNLAVTVENCVFRKQLGESLLLSRVSYLKVKKTLFKKSALLDAERAAVFVQVDESRERKDVHLLECEFRKSAGVGLVVSGVQGQAKNVGVRVEACVFHSCMGAAAAKFQDLSGHLQGRFDRDSNAAEDLRDDMVKVLDCEFANNKRNGIVLANVFSQFTIKRTVFRENRFSGVRVDQDSHECDLTVCRCLGQSASADATQSAKGRIQNKIEGCTFSMNQMHGLEVLNYQRNDLIVSNCQIEDNFCDGVLVSSEDYGINDLLPEKLSS